MKVQRDATPKSGWRPLGSALLFAAMAVILIWLSAGDGEHFPNGLMLAAGAVLCALLELSRWVGREMGHGMRLFRAALVTGLLILSGAAGNLVMPEQWIVLGLCSIWTLTLWYEFFTTFEETTDWKQFLDILSKSSTPMPGWTLWTSPPTSPSWRTCWPRRD